MRWRLSDRADPSGRVIADRHYSRVTPGATQFVHPGRCIVLVADEGKAVWATSWPIYTQHAWKGAWENSLFRKEDGPEHASEYIREAVAATRAVAETQPFWEAGRIPPIGMISFIDPSKVKPRMIRSRPTWGHAYFEAGFSHVGYTKKGLWTFRLRPEDMPEPKAPIGWQSTFLSEESA